MTPDALARKSLDRRFKELRSSGAWTRPPRGWVRAIRDALNMTSRQLANRLGLNQSTISALEKGEVQGTVTLNRLQQAAEALDCRLVYALIPNRPLEKILRGRAERLVDAQLNRMNHTMRLENQALSDEDLDFERNRLVEDLVRTQSRRLWDEA